MSPKHEDAAERDKIIGANIARLRGPWSQSRLAELMSERGWAWTQSIVSAIEAGSRSLRLAEATTLCQVLGVGYFEVANPKTPQIDKLREEIQRANHAQEQIRQAVEEYQNARTQILGNLVYGDLVAEDLTELERFSARDHLTTAVQDIFDGIRLTDKAEWVRNEILSDGHTGSTEHADNPYMRLLEETFDREREWAMSRPEPAP